MSDESKHRRLMIKKELVEELNKYPDDAEVILWSYDDRTGSKFQYLMFGATQSYPGAVLVAGDRHAVIAQQEMVELYR